MNVQKHIAKRVSGFLLGSRMVATGQLRLISSYGGSISGRMNVLNGQLDSLRTPEHQSRAGRIGGSASGGKKKSAWTPERRAAQATRALVCIQDGTITPFDAPTVEHQRVAAHSRWHVKRGVVKSNCEFCQVVQHV